MKIADLGKVKVFKNVIATNGVTYRIAVEPNSTIDPFQTRYVYPTSIKVTGGTLYLRSVNIFSPFVRTIVDDISGFAKYYEFVSDIEIYPGKDDKVPPPISYPKNGNGAYAGETNWLLYGAIALVAFLLLRN